CGEYKEITIDKRILVKLAKDRELVVTAAKNIAQTADERVSELYTMLKRYSGKYSKSQEKLKNIASIVQQLQQTLDFEEREKVKFRLKVEEMEKRISAMSSSHHTCAICMDKAVNIAFIPCGHATCCQRCAEKIMESSGKCPLCRNDYAFRDFSVSPSDGSHASPTYSPLSSQESFSDSGSIILSPRQPVSPVKKVKQHRKKGSCKFSEVQTKLLMEHFLINPRPDAATVEMLSSHTSLSQQQVKIWFQNRRARTKKRKTRKGTSGPTKNRLPAKIKPRVIKPTTFVSPSPPVIASTSNSVQYCVDKTSILPFDATRPPCAFTHRAVHVASSFACLSSLRVLCDCAIHELERENMK
ncbi:hypothetical protein ADUPG1_014257, partial [Aduncisulcus paluster]